MYGDGTALESVLRIFEDEIAQRHISRFFCRLHPCRFFRTEVHFEIRKRTRNLFAVDGTVDLYIAQAEELAAIKARHIETQADGLSGSSSDCVRVVQRRRTGGVVVTQQVILRNGFRSSLYAIHGVRPVIRSAVRTLFDSVVLHACKGKGHAFLHLHAVLDHRGSVRTGFASCGIESRHRLTRVSGKIITRTFSQPRAYFAFVLFDTIRGVRGYHGIVRTVRPFDSSGYIVKGPGIDAQQST